MKIDGTAPTQGPEGRRFQAAKSIPAKEGGKSFGALLKKAATAPPAAAQSAPAQAQAPAASSAPSMSEASTAAASAPAAQAPAASGSKAGKKSAESGSADFANHMEMVKLRLKSGFYNNANVDDALSEKLTGFFDDLA
jgi:hypothetical protein